MSTFTEKQLVVDELRKTVEWLMEQRADSKLTAAVVHALQLTLARFVAEVGAGAWYECPGSNGARHARVLPRHS